MLTPITNCISFSLTCFPDCCRLPKISIIMDSKILHFLAFTTMSHMPKIHLTSDGGGKREKKGKITQHLTIILRNRAEYHLILSRRGRRPSWLNERIFRKIEQNNCFIIQQFLIDYHFQNEKNYGFMMKTLKASNT